MGQQHTLSFECGRCHVELEADQSLGGQLLDCPACGEKVRVPSIKVASESALEPGPPASATMKTPRSLAGDTGKPPEGRKRRRVMVWGLFAMAGAGLLVGLVCMAMAKRKRALDEIEAWQRKWDTQRAESIAKIDRRTASIIEGLSRQTHNVVKESFASSRVTVKARELLAASRITVSNEELAEAWLRAKEREGCPRDSAKFLAAYIILRRRGFSDSVAVDKIVEMANNVSAGSLERQLGKEEASKVFRQLFGLD